MFFVITCERTLLFDQCYLKDIAVFEGFFSLLSYQTLKQESPALTNYLVLNSLSFFEKSRSLMEKNGAINLYLDQDTAGKTSTQKGFGLE